MPADHHMCNVGRYCLAAAAAPAVHSPERQPQLLHSRTERHAPVVTCKAR